MPLEISATWEKTSGAGSSWLSQDAKSGNRDMRTPNFFIWIKWTEWNRQGDEWALDRPWTWENYYIWENGNLTEIEDFSGKTTPFYRYKYSYSITSGIRIRRRNTKRGHFPDVFHRRIPGRCRVFQKCHRQRLRYVWIFRKEITVTSCNITKTTTLYL